MEIRRSALAGVWVQGSKAIDGPRTWLVVGGDRRGGLATHSPILVRDELARSVGPSSRELLAMFGQARRQVAGSHVRAEYVRAEDAWLRRARGANWKVS